MHVMSANIKCIEQKAFPRGVLFFAGFPAAESFQTETGGKKADESLFSEHKHLKKDSSADFLR